MCPFWKRAPCICETTTQPKNRSGLAIWAESERSFFSVAIGESEMRVGTNKSLLGGGRLEELYFTGPLHSFRPHRDSRNSLPTNLHSSVLHATLNAVDLVHIVQVHAPNIYNMICTSTTRKNIWYCARLGYKLSL